MSDQGRQDKIISELSDWGCDIPGTMNRFSNDRNLFFKLLSYVPKQQEFNELGEMLQSGDVKGAFEKAHSLKGVLGNMGLTPMYEEAVAVTEPLRAGKTDGVQEHYEKLMQSLDRLCEIIGSGQEA